MRRFLAGLMAVVATLGAVPISLAVSDGDIVFQTSRSSQSEAIQRATGSAYSHMGLILFRKGRPCVLEAVATVRYTPLALGLQIGKLQRLKEFNLTDPVVLAKLHERYGRQIPVEESVVSPVAMFQSPLLVTV